MDISAWIAFGSLLSVMFIQTAAVAFWMGGLSARARSNTDRITEIEKGDGAEGVRMGDVGQRLTKLETLFDAEMKHITDSIGQLGREVRGMSRQLSSLTSHGKGRVPPLSDTLSDE